MVGSSSTSTLTSLAISTASDARVRSPGDNVVRMPEHVVGDEAELGEQRPRVALVEARDVLERPQQRAGGSVIGALPNSWSRAWAISPTTTARTARDGAGTGRDMTEQGVEQRRLARAVGSDDGDPLTGGDQQIDGSEAEAGAVDDDAIEAGDDVAGAAGGGDVEPQVPRHPGLVDDLEAGDRPLRAGGSSSELLGLVDAVSGG